jgi:hypothetical protein
MRGCTRAKCVQQRDLPAKSASVGGHGGNTHGGLLQAGQHTSHTHTPLSLLQQSSSFLGPWHAQASGQRDTCRSDDWAERLATAPPRARAFRALHACLARCGRSGRDLSLSLPLPSALRNERTAASSSAPLSVCPARRANQSQTLQCFAARALAPSGAHMTAGAFACSHPRRGTVHTARCTRYCYIQTRQTHAA